MTGTVAEAATPPVPTPPVPGQPFAVRTVLAMVLFGALAFVMALYFIGAGETGGSANDGGAHAGGTGLNGYAALAQLLEKRGWEVVRSRSEGDLTSEDLVVLTPPHYADGAKIAEILERRRFAGPTIIILPKWQAAPAGTAVPKAKRGWVMLGDATSPSWEGFADDVRIATGKSSGWTSEGLKGDLPRSQEAQWASDDGPLWPAVTASEDETRLLAAYLEREGEEAHEPVMLVFEPDLLNNYGMGKGASALLADRLFGEMAPVEGRRVRFDLTLNGLGRTDNLLTLAFTPPFLAATLCLLLAASITAWRALRRFGPVLSGRRAIAFGKRQLVRNTAGLILQTRRFHLLGAPYAMLLNNRIARLLGQRPASLEEAEQAIDRALAARGQGPHAFTTLAEKLRHARKPHELLRRAQALRQLERTLET